MVTACDAVQSGCGDCDFVLDLGVVTACDFVQDSLGVVTEFVQVWM